MRLRRCPLSMTSRPSNRTTTSPRFNPARSADPFACRSVTIAPFTSGSRKILPRSGVTSCVDAPRNPRTTRPVLMRLCMAAPGHIAGNRKADADASAGGTGNGRIDPHHFAIDIDQRSAGVAWVDRRIGLNKIFKVGDADIRTPHGADNAERHSAAQAQWISDGQHKIADSERAGISPCGRRQARRIDFHDCDIGFGIGGHHASFDIAAGRRG